MPSEPSIKRTVAFGDGQNLYHASRVKLPGGLLPYWWVTYPFHQFHQRLPIKIGGPRHLCPILDRSVVRGRRVRAAGFGLSAHHGWENALRGHRQYGTFNATTRMTGDAKATGGATPHSHIAVMGAWPGRASVGAERRKSTWETTSLRAMIIGKQRPG